MVGDAKRRKPPCLIFKVDFEKAYDCVLMEIFILYDEQYMLKDGAFCVPKSSLFDSLIKGTHDESVMLHGFSLGTYMEHETLKCFCRCIVHKRDKFKDFVHHLKMSILDQ